MDNIKLVGSMRPIEIYGEESAPFWELFLKNEDITAERTQFLEYVLGEISSELSCDSVLVRFDEGISRAAVEPFKDNYSFYHFMECPSISIKRNPIRSILGFGSIQNLLDFLDIAKLWFLHDVTLIFADNFEKTYNDYFNNMFDSDFPQIDTLNMYPCVCLMSLNDSIVNIVGKKEFILSISEKLSFRNDESKSSSLKP